MRSMLPRVFGASCAWSAAEKPSVNIHAQAIRVVFISQFLEWLPIFRWNSLYTTFIDLTYSLT